MVRSCSSESDAKQRLLYDLKELGYEVPATLPVDSNGLRAVVHHEYASYLLQLPHMEYEVLRHEEIVGGLMPDFGESFLNCAVACNRIGDSCRALDFVRRAEKMEPRYLDCIGHDFIVAAQLWRCYQDVGDISEAKKAFERCMELAQSPLFADRQQHLAGLAHVANDAAYWHRAAKLSKVREKSFSAGVAYRILPLGIEFLFPADWKIESEGVTGLDEIEHFSVSFVPQSSWDSDAKALSDACISMTYTSLRDDMALNGETYGLRCLRNLRAAFGNRLTWSPESAVQNLERAIERRWSFETQGPWPKKGVLHSYELRQGRICFSAMCATCGEAKFWPVLSTVAEAFSRQDCFVGSS